MSYRDEINFTVTLELTNYSKVEMTRRCIVIIHNALAHSISKQKHELIYVSKKARTSRFEDLSYPQVISKLRGISVEFNDTVELYNRLLKSYTWLDDIAHVEDESYKWLRARRK